MNHISRLFLLVALIVGILAVSVTATFADQDDPQAGETWVVNVGSNTLNVFSQPNGNRVLNWALPSGTSVEVITSIRDSNWVWTLVVLPDGNSTGWVVATTNGRQWNMTRDANNASDAVPGVQQAEIDVLVTAADGNVSLLLSLIDEQFDANWYLIGRQWSRNDVANGNVSIVGPAYFWTDLLDSISVLPSGTTRVATQGNWGVYRVAPSATFRVEMPNGGGRTIPIATGNQVPSGNDNGCQDLADLEEAVNDLDGTQAVIDYMDQDFDHQTSPYFSAGTKQFIPTNSVGVIWTDFGPNNVPQGAEPLVSNSTTGGWGVWTLQGPAEFNPRGGGGMVILNCIGQNG